MEFDEPDYDNMERKLEYLQEIFCESVYGEVSLGNDVDLDDLLETLQHFTKRRV
jgi:hypothetical protein